MTVDIAPARSESEIAAMRTLFREYAESLSFDLCFQDFEKELSGLPGKYAEPDGVMLLAQAPDELAACVALRPLDGNGICEMKRLYVRPAFRRNGLGKKLAVDVMERARECGYSHMRLDTMDDMHAARNLYESLGFEEIGPYCHNPHDRAVYMECPL